MAVSLCLTNMLSRDLPASSASLSPIAFVLIIPNMFTENFEKISPIVTVIFLSNQKAY